MELTITRTYHPHGTNGALAVNGKPFCFTIELPWKNNTSKLSCIPEGTYPLVRRFSVPHKHHLLVQQVPGRSLILFHTANHAEKELQGCIAPVSTLTGEGRGDSSRAAFHPLMKLVGAALDRGEAVTLTITTNH